jgi:arylformamidase
MQLAQYPLAVPYLLNPVGIVGLMTISADAESWSVFAVEFGILVFVLLLDVVVFRLANRVSEKLDENRMLVTEKVFGFLIAAIAVQLVLDGLALEGIIAHVPHLRRGSDISPASDDMQAVPLTLASGQVSPGHMRWPGEPTGGRQTLPMSRRTVVANSVMTDWIDVSVTVRHGMPHWPDNPPIVLERVLDTGRGDACNVSHLAMGVHSGTHMDGPVHFIHGAGGLDEMPLTATMGEARVIEIEHPREITADELRKHGLQPGERVLFRTSNSVLCWQSGSFVEDFVSISEQAAMLLAETKVRTVGIDYLSVGGYLSDGAKIHKILLEAGIWIIEGLDLSPVVGGRYEMICLPVKLHGSDGAPARAILRPIGSSGLGRAVSVQAVS